MTTIACVLKSGGWPTVADVARLAADCAEHAPEHRFVCLSDVPEIPGVEVIPLVHNLPGWWSKLEMGRPGVLTGPTLYLDLDTRIVGDISDMSEYRGKPLILRDFYRPLAMIGSGVMLWSENMLAPAWNAFAEAPAKIMQQNPTRMDRFIVQHLPEHGFVQDEFPGKVVSYKAHCRERVPDGVSVVAFHGRPRPSEVTLRFAA